MQIGLVFFVSPEEDPTLTENGKERRDKITEKERGGGREREEGKGTKGESEEGRKVRKEGREKRRLNRKMGTNSS